MEEKLSSNRIRVSTTLRGFIFTAASAVIFGTMPLFTKLVNQNGLSSFFMLWVRATFVLPFLYLISRRSARAEGRISRKDLGEIALLSLLGAVATPLLLMRSYDFLATGASTSLHFSYPLFVLILSSVIYKDRNSPRTILCFALCMTGIALAYTPGSKSSVTGILLALISGVCFALHTLFMDKLRILERVSSFRFAFWLSAVSSAVLTVFGLLLHLFPERISWKGALLAMTFALLEGLMGSVLFQKGVKYINSRSASLISALEPVTSIVLGFAILKEAITVRGLASVVLIILASILLVIFTSSGKLENN